MNEDWIAVWDALEESERARILAKLKAAAKRHASSVRDLYASNAEPDPNIEIRDCTREGEVLRIVYLFDWWEWCPAQSGSDWNYHKVCTGIATFDGPTLRAHEVTERRSNYVHESSEDSYKAAAEVQAVRDELANSI